VRHDHHDDDPELGYAAEELVAESVAQLAVSFVGLNSRASAIPYLAFWAQSAPADSFQEIVELVDRLARRLEDTLADHDITTTAGSASSPSTLTAPVA
jgi:hypothetical protein